MNCVVWMGGFGRGTSGEGFAMLMRGVPKIVGVGGDGRKIDSVGIRSKGSAGRAGKREINS